MNLIPLRAAVIAGTCAVALSFVSVPAFASVAGDSGTSSSSCTTSDTSDTSGDAAGDVTDDSGTSDTTGPTDDSTSAPLVAFDDTGDSTDADATGTDDTAGTDDTCVTDDDGDSSDDGDTTDAPVVLPAEKGHPKQHFADTVFTPKQIAKKGIKVEYTGLTAGSTYQPFYSTGESGGPLGNLKKASKKGTISFTYKFDKTEKKSFAALGAVYTVGLLGQDTDLRLAQTVSVKYDSDLSWTPAERHGGKVTLSVSVNKDNASGKSVDWKKAKVEFQKKVGTKWVTVRTVKTNAGGVASATVKSSKKIWRAVLETSRSVIGTTSKGHKA